MGIIFFGVLLVVALIALIGSIVKSTAHSLVFHDTTIVVHWMWHHYIGWIVVSTLIVGLFMRLLGETDITKRIALFYIRLLTAPFLRFTKERRAAQRANRPAKAARLTAAQEAAEDEDDRAALAELDLMRPGWREWFPRGIPGPPIPPTAPAADPQPLPPR